MKFKCISSVATSSLGANCVGVSRHLRVIGNELSGMSCHGTSCQGTSWRSAHYSTLVWPNYTMPTLRKWKSAHIWPLPLLHWTLHLSLAMLRPCSAMAFISWAFSGNEKREIRASILRTISISFIEEKSFMLGFLQTNRSFVFLLAVDCAEHSLDDKSWCSCHCYRNAKMCFPRHKKYLNDVVCCCQQKHLGSIRCK